MSSSTMVGKSVKLAELSGESLICRIPPDVWEMITKNINSSKDLVNLSEVIPSCAKVVYSKRVEWLFYQVLPLLITNLFGTFKMISRKDVFKCRLVCKHWKFGVDNFFEDNALHCPASGDNVDWKLERCHFAETFYYNSSDILGREFKTEKLQKIIEETASYPNNPIVGKYLNLHVPSGDKGFDLVEHFIATFGRQIHYLRLLLNIDSCPVSNLLMLTTILPNLPNLKGLTVEKFNFNEPDTGSAKSVCFIKRKFNELQKSVILTDSFRNGLPKIETLHINILDVCGDILSQIILSMFSLERLTSLIILEYFVSDQINMRTPNLLYLRLVIEKHEQLKTLLKFDCPLIRKIELQLDYEKLDYDLLRKVLQKFQDRINHLTLHLPNPEQNFDANKVETKQMTDFFTNPYWFKMKEIITVTLIGHCPLSFNFICGDGFKSLKYLNLYLNKRNTHSLTSSNEDILLLGAQDFERTDIIEKLEPIWLDEPWEWKRPQIYDSNVWLTFPKLKAVHVARYEFWEPLCRNGWTYRRNYLI